MRDGQDCHLPTSVQVDDGDNLILVHIVADDGLGKDIKGVS